MKPCTMILLSVWLVTGSALADERLGVPDIEALADADAPSGVTIALEEKDGGMVVRVTNANATPTSVSLGEIPLTSVRGPKLEFVATMSSEDVEGTVYLEMWALRGEEAYFSRALNDTFSGTQAERTTSTPFFLKEGEHLDAARVGVRFEGPGSAILRDMALWRRGSIPFLQGRRDVAVSRWSATVGFAGSVFGVASAIWAGVAGFLAWKGLGRRGVLWLTMGLVIASVFVLVLGYVLWTDGMAWTVWYPLVLLGGIGLTNFSVGFAVLRWWYGRTEARRMAAMDLR